MPKGPKGEKRPAGTVECAYEVFQIATGNREEDLPSGRRQSGYAGAAARASHFSNCLAPSEYIPRFNADTPEMAVTGHKTIAVVNFYHIAVGAPFAGAGNNATGRGQNPCAWPSCHIQPVMHGGCFVQRVPPTPEAA